MTQKTIRCFFAVDVDAPEVVAKILEAQERLFAAGADLKLVAYENIHITLRFLGEIPEGLLGEVVAASENVVFVPFRAELREVGVFPNLERINVVWVSIGEGSLGFLSLFQSLESGLRHLGLRSDGRGFSPHLTIARVRSGRNLRQLADVVRNLREAEFGGFDVTRFKLKKSILTPKGPTYSDIASFQAGGL